MSDKYAMKAQEFMRAWADDEITDTHLEGMLARALRESAAEAFLEASKAAQEYGPECEYRAPGCDFCDLSFDLEERAAALRRPA